MKKISFLIIAAIAMISCGNNTNYTAQVVELNNLNDSMNYALGLVNGVQIKRYQLRNDSSMESLNEFIDALQRGYNGEVEELSQVAGIGMSIAQSIKASESIGLADNPAWTLNEKIFFQGMVNALYGDTVVMTETTATTYFETAYQESATSNDSTQKAGKPIKGKCPKSIKHPKLKTQNDSLNYAFGFMNGNSIAMYVLLSDSTNEMKKEFIASINKGLTSKIKNPQLVASAEQIGMSIKEQEKIGLVGEPSLITNFELIKQGFINGMLDQSEWDWEEAGQYIQNTMITIKYGEHKAKGEQFLTENALKEGVTTTASGLQYEVLKKGRGRITPKATDRVKVHYHGTLIDGTVFDSSVDRGEPIIFALTQVIPGWTEALQLMTVGSKYRLYIPQALGYGSQSTGNIPPYSTLIFEVELLEIVK